MCLEHLRKNSRTTENSRLTLLFITMEMGKIDVAEYKMSTEEEEVLQKLKEMNINLEAKQVGPELEDILGYKNGNKALEQLFYYAKHPRFFQAQVQNSLYPMLGQVHQNNHPRHILFFGPSAVDMTSIIEKLFAATNANNCTFFHVRMADLESARHSNEAKLLTAVFKAAKEHENSIVFLDRCEPILKLRNDKDSYLTSCMKTLLRTELSGNQVVDKPASKLVIIASSNRPWEMDHMLRPLFSERIYLRLPITCERTEILRKELMQYSHEISEDGIRFIARYTRGYSTQEIKDLVRYTSNNLQILETKRKLNLVMTAYIVL